MTYSTKLHVLSLLALSPLTALARTDLAGCTSFTSMVTVNPTAHGYGNVYPSIVYYVPDTLEICDIPDCGGGRAPPKTNVPGCPLYSGTATPTPSFLSADPLAPATAAHSTAAVAVVVEPSHLPAPTHSVPAEESLHVAAVGTSGVAAETTDSEAVHSVVPVSGPDTVTVATVTSTLGPVNVSPVGTPGAASHANGTGVKGNGTGGVQCGNGTGQPSKPLDTTASGSVLGVTMAGLSVALGAAAFVL